ncbi:MAG: restriction endonuclease subunit S [Treponema sp.]|nr:restriction endonuclease subunit S [Treponema sp.]
MSTNYRKLGEIVELIDERNKSLESSEVLGISIDKEFMPSVANTIGTDLSNYKLLRMNTFACNPMHVGRDERLPVSLYKKDIPAIVSPAYFMFRVKDENKVLPDFLMLIFKRDDFDRNCWFRTDGSVRGGITWNDICEIEFPVPDLKEQEKIVNTYNAITKRIHLKQKINENLEKTAQTIYRKMFVEDADEKWETVKLEKVIEVRYGKDHKNLEEGNIPVYGSGGIMRYANKYLYDKESVMIPRKGSLNNIIYTDEPFWSVDTMFYTSMKKQNFAKYFYEFIRTKDFLNLDTGSAVPSMTTDYLNNIEILNPDNTTLEKFESKVSRLYISKKNNYKEISKLQELKQLVISRISGM